MLTIMGMSVVTFSPGQPHGCWIELELEVVDADRAQLRPAEVEQLVALATALCPVSRSIWL